VLSGSGRADLALAHGVAAGNCFAGNTYVTSLPAKIEEILPCDGQSISTNGDASVAADLAVSVPDALDRLALRGPRPDWRSMPALEAQPSSPDQLAAGLRPFRPDDRGPIVAASVVVAVVATGLILVARRRSRKLLAH